MARLSKLKDVVRLNWGAKRITVRFCVAMRCRDRDISNSGQQCFGGAKAVKAEMARLAESFPPGMKYQVALTRPHLCGKSLAELVKTVLKSP